MTSLLPEKFTFTQSNLQAYVNCKYQFYLRYIEHFLWPAPATTDMLSFERDRQAGSRFHQLVHQLLLGLPASDLTLSAENDPDPRVGHWFDLFTRTIFKDLSGKLFPEYTLTANLEGLILSAKYDLLRQTGEVYTIYDWKSSRRKPSKMWLEAQMQSKVFPLVLSLQPALTADSAERHLRMVYWEVTEPEQPVVLEYSRAKLNAYQSEISALVSRIKAGAPQDFQKTADVQRCRTCIYRSFCNRPSEPASLEEYLSSEYLALEEDTELLSEG
ncbi:MAG: PD-(D/E)XK nuclease family protein [Anaerolineaceae bacterium]